MLHAQITFVDVTTGHHAGYIDTHETFSDDRGELYRAFRHEYGRCISRIYVDTADDAPSRYGAQIPANAKPVGWVFLKRCQYDDSPDTYLQETWVTIHEREPTKTIKYHYA